MRRVFENVLTTQCSPTPEGILLLLLLLLLLHIYSGSITHEADWGSLRVVWARFYVRWGDCGESSCCAQGRVSHLRLARFL